MKFETTMCHTHLVSMMLMPELLQRAVVSYTSTAPDYENEGFNGYMEIKVTFMLRDLDEFNVLWNESRVYPSDRADWYDFIRNNVSKCMRNEDGQK